MTARSKEVNDLEVLLEGIDALLLVGDNADHLKSLAESSSNQVDLIYVDAPYNTGSNLIYADNRKGKRSGILGSHIAWYNFMLQRIENAKVLLKDTGVIALSIDDYEFAYLKVLLDNVFGEKNMLGCVTVCRSKNGRGSKKNVSTNHEYLLLYGKTAKASIRGVVDTTEYPKKDKHGLYRTDGLFRKKGDASLREDRPNLYYPLFVNKNTGDVSVDKVEGWDLVYPLDSKGVERRWVWSKDTAKKRVKELYSSKNGVVYIKSYAGDKKNIKRTKVKTIWDNPSFYTERATGELKKVFGIKVFDTPKALSLMKQIIDICCNENAIVLDIFAGSGTTAQAIAELNIENKAQRRCVLIESSDSISRNHIAAKTGFNRIFEITERRLNLIEKGTDNYLYKVHCHQGVKKETPNA